MARGKKNPLQQTAKRVIASDPQSRRYRAAQKYLSRPMDPTKPADFFAARKELLTKEQELAQKLTRIESELEYLNTRLKASQNKTAELQKVQATVEADLDSKRRHRNSSNYSLKARYRRVKRALDEANSQLVENNRGIVAFTLRVPVLEADIVKTKEAINEVADILTRFKILKFSNEV